MAYTKSYPVWHDDPVHDTPITAAKLNNIEDGISNAHTDAATETAARIAADSAESTARANGDTAQQAYTDAHITDTLDAHDASAISVVPVGIVSSPDVQGALGQLQGAIVGGGMPSTIIDAKGDLIVGAADDSPAKLAVGANGKALMADSAAPNGVKWGDVATGSDATKVDKDTVSAATARLVANKLAAPDANETFKLRADGRMDWGAGGATAPDVSLYRVGADILATDDRLLIIRANDLDIGFNSQKVGDGQSKWRTYANGRMEWGPGNAATDVALYRSAQDILKLDDKFDPASFNVPTKAGVPADGDVTGGAQDGDLIVDTTGKILYVRIAGVWTACGGGASGGADYEGVWSGATPYVKGDVVVYNGVNYIAVNDSTGVTPAGGTAADFGIALPSSPFDGQQFTLVDSLTAPTWSWMFRYVAAKASNKWIFVGGTSAFAQVLTLETTGGSTYQALTTAGPSIALPVAGDYEVGIGFLSTPTSAAATGRMSYDIGGTGAVDADCCGYDNTDSKIGSVSKFATKSLTAVTLTSKYKSNAAGHRFSARWMKVTPIAVGG